MRHQTMQTWWSSMRGTQTVWARRTSDPARKQAGRPPHGNGGAAAVTMVPTTPLGGTVEYDYQNSLPPDLRRAAPELYRNCRRTGSGTVRGLVKDVVDKEHDDYASLWDGGTIADFEIAKCKTAQDLHQLLATSDALEILFRRIASHMHLKKTGDHQGAQDMLAVKAPSMKSELPPRLAAGRGRLSRAGRVQDISTRCRLDRRS